MATEFYETMFIIKGARAETEDDLNQLFEDFRINGGQLAASFGPPTFVMDANLTHDAVPVTSPERVGPSAASMVDLIVPTLEPVDEAFLAAPLGPSAYMIEKNLSHDEDPAATVPESGRRCKRGPRKRRIPLCTDQGWFLGDHFGGTSCLRDAPSANEGRNRGLRTNGPHWRTEEVTTLVDGLEEFGGRQWSAIKKKYFRTSDRTTTNLKVNVWCICLMLIVLP
uniref:Myb-like domain-containing protein n=1 Tax=Triticum urartu TaxID=4572 RepID=A0A8R7P9N2_TRIUA